MAWNFDMSQAPKGVTKTYTSTLKGQKVSREVHVPENIIAAGNDGVVTVSYWVEKQQRWNMFSKDTPPLAWQPFPEHPHKE